MDSVDDWIEFLINYSRGNDCQPPAYRYDGGPTSPPLPSFDIPLYPPGGISANTARIISTFYAQYNFLPPPRAEEELKRRAVIAEYNLFRSDQTVNFDRCSALVSSIFNFAPICTISLFQHDTQVVVSKVGENFPVEAGEALVTESSICGHVVLKKTILELAQINDDWRFLGNPWCSRTGGRAYLVIPSAEAYGRKVQGYIGVPIILDADPSSPNASEPVTVGVLALMSSEPFPALSASQRDILHNITAMLSAQLRSTWEGWRGGRETRMRDTVSVFLERALVEPYQHAVVKAQSSADPVVQGSSPRSPFENKHRRMLSTTSLFASGADQIRELLEADFVALVDLAVDFLRFISKLPAQHLGSGLPFMGPYGRQVAPPVWNLQFAKVRRPTRQLHVAAINGEHRELPRSFRHRKSLHLSAFTAIDFLETGRSIFPAPWGCSGLEALLVSGAAGVKRKRGASNTSVSHIAIPFYSDDRPRLLIIVSSAAPLLTFNQSDVTFVRNVGLVLMASMAQNAVVEASAHKTGALVFAALSSELILPRLQHFCRR